MIKTTFREYPNQKLTAKEFRKLYEEVNNEPLARPQILEGNEILRPSMFEFLEMLKFKDLKITEDRCIIFEMDVTPELVREDGVKNAWGMRKNDSDGYNEKESDTLIPNEEEDEDQEQEQDT